MRLPSPSPAASLLTHTLSYSLVSAAARTATAELAQASPGPRHVLGRLGSPPPRAVLPAAALPLVHLLLFPRSPTLDGQVQEGETHPARLASRGSPAAAHACVNDTERNTGMAHGDQAEASGNRRGGNRRATTALSLPLDARFAQGGCVQAGYAEHCPPLRSRHKKATLHSNQLSRKRSLAPAKGLTGQKRSPSTPVNQGLSLHPATHVTHPVCENRPARSS